MDPVKIQNRIDLSHQMIRRNDLVQVELVEKMTLIPLLPSHHRNYPRRLSIKRRNHCSQAISTGVLQQYPLNCGRLNRGDILSLVTFQVNLAHSERIPARLTWIDPRRSQYSPATFVKGNLIYQKGGLSCMRHFVSPLTCRREALARGLICRTSFGHKIGNLRTRGRRGNHGC